MRKIFANVALAGVSVLFALLFAELALRWIAPFPDPLHPHKIRKHAVPAYVPSAFPAGLHLELRVDEDLPGMPRTSVFSTNNLGFRGDELLRPKPAGETRIFMIGGSSTECLYLDDSQAITHVLQQQLAARGGNGATFRVYNAGKSGDRSYDHLAMLAHRIAHLEPDLVIVFAGVNDLLSGIWGRDYLLFPERHDTHWTFWPLMRLAVTEFQLGRRLYALSKSLDERQVMEQISLSSDYRSKIETRKAAPIRQTLPSLDIESYRRNLVSIVGLARNHGVPLVFMTQATTWASRQDPGIREFHWLSFVNGVTYDEDALADGMDLYNEVMRAVGAEHGVPVFDLAGELPLTRRYFFDDVHFNVTGADTTGVLLATFLQAEVVMP